MDTEWKREVIHIRFENSVSTTDFTTRDNTAVPLVNFLFFFNFFLLRRNRIVYLYTVSKHIKQFHTRYKLTYTLGT